MKNSQLKWKQLLAGAGIFLLCATVVNAQVRTGGGGFGFGGFGGFGGGGGNRGGNTSSTYNNNGAVGSATFSVDPDTHSIVFTADAKTAEQIKEVIASLDRPKPQVLIKVVFMEVQHNDSSDIGVEGGWTGGAGNGMVANAANVFGLSDLNSGTESSVFTRMISSLTGGSSNTTSTTTTTRTLNQLGQPVGSLGAPGAGMYQILGNDFQATIRAIAQSGKAQLLSRPSVLARDGQMARIVVGQKVPLPTSVSYNTSGTDTAVIPIVNVTYTDVGIILNVTPFIGSDGEVEMIIQPSTTAVSLTQSQTIAPGVNAPYLDERSADTVVVTPNGQTVVVGGLMQNSKSSSESKIPFLGDIPLLGNLFKSKSKADAKSELLIFLTPHVMQMPNQLAAMSNQESRTWIPPESFTEQELNKFLEGVPVMKDTDPKSHKGK